ncbi:MAG: hypothetical protein ACYDDI_01015 [Candidatus Acidiferrales bacterium]
MRWWKRFREDLDRPAFQAGIEKFGTGFAHDVDRIWQLLCVEDGPGIRELPLTDETVGMLARQFRVTPEETKERLEFMRTWGLIEIKAARKGESQVIASSELRRRRDEWSKRKSRELKGKAKTIAPESLRSNSGVAPEQRQRQRSEAKAESNSLSNIPDGMTGCVRNAEDLFEYVGIDKKRIAKKYLAPNAFERAFEDFAKTYVDEWSHDGDECSCSPVDFLDIAMDELKNQGIEWPKCLLARKRELDATN